MFLIKRKVKIYIISCISIGFLFLILSRIFINSNSINNKYVITTEDGKIIKNINNIDSNENINILEEQLKNGHLDETSELSNENEGIGEDNLVKEIISDNENYNEEKNEIIIDKNKNSTVNKSYINNDKADNSITELKQLEIERNMEKEIIENYKGEELEPEWEWAKSVSVVYTWVNGDDVNFTDIKSKYNGGYRSFNSRDRNVDELRYSLRSLEQYMPWHNGTIFIVTDNQVPKWLDTSNSKIKIVYHKDIIQEHYRPTYDANTIELFLDRIPGVTEYFIYFNDDMFLNNYVHPCFFFTRKNHYPKVYRSHIVELTKEKTDEIIKKNSVVQMFQASKYFTREIIREYFDPEFEYRYYLHTAYVIYRDLMEPFRQLFKEEIKPVCSDRFRNPFKPHLLYMYQSYLYYATKHEDFPLKIGGIGKAKNVKGTPLPNDRERTIKKYSCEMVPPKTSATFVKFGSINNGYDNNAKRFERFRNDIQLRVYNLNDEYTKDEALYQLVRYMITRYPTPSQFEKKEYVDLDLKVLPLLDSIEELSKNEQYDEFYNKDSEEERTALKEDLKKLSFEIVINYLNKKEALSEPQNSVSVREEEEVKFLLNYSNSSQELEKDWQWVSNISIVYGLNNEIDINQKNTMLMTEQLKFSIRSIEKYLPWFKGKIFIITKDKSNNDLTWVDKSNKRIQIIPQSQLLPSKYKNTTKKNLFEMYLDKIPGLTERFIYIKYNHFFIKYTHPRFFLSNTFYPKYNYYSPLEKDDVKSLSEINKPLYATYNIIKKYFGESYFRSYRYLFDTPYPFYRDLFEPARQLFNEDIDEIVHNKKSAFYPIYLISNYNIYGTSQPYYPEYVSGYGEIRNKTAPILNKDRTIDYYGYDIPSVYTIEKVIHFNVAFSQNSEKNEKNIKRILNSQKIFFNLRTNNIQKFTSKNKKQLYRLMESLYQDKSSFKKKKKKKKF